MEVAVPGPKDTVQQNLIGIKGNAGVEVEKSLVEKKLITRFHEIIGRDSDTSTICSHLIKKESGIFARNI